MATGTRLRRFWTLALLMGPLIVTAPACGEASFLDTLRRVVSPGEVAITDSLHLRLGNEVRLGVSAMGNVVDLGEDGSDTQVYANIVARHGLTLSYRGQASLFGEVEFSGPSRYAAPLFGDDPIRNATGEVSAYLDTEDVILPKITQLGVRWTTTAVRGMPVTLQAGLIPHQVADTYALSGKYANLGATLSGQGERIFWRLHYERPDQNHRLWLGGRPAQEQAFGYDDTKADFYAIDAAVTAGPALIRPYLSLLADDTAPEDRASLFAAPIEKDRLWTAGSALRLALGPVDAHMEGAFNFGEATSADPAIGSIPHEGWMARARGSVFLGVFQPFAQVMAASGNRLPQSEFDSLEAFRPKANRAFSVYSPFNLLLFDTRYPDFLSPVVASGSGFSLNTGIPRPGSYGDPHLLENLVAVNAGVTMRWGPYFLAQASWWLLRSLEPGYGLALVEEVQGIPRFETISLPQELGHEIDLYAQYRLTDAVRLTALVGCFLPGAYYETRRDDDDPYGLSPVVSPSGNPKTAFQLEAGVELFF